MDGRVLIQLRVEGRDQLVPLAGGDDVAVHFCQHLGLRADGGNVGGADEGHGDLAHAFHLGHGVEAAQLPPVGVDRSIDTVFTADEIAAYYNAHKADFKLDRTIVKGRIVRFGEGYRQAAKLKTLMGARSEAQQQDFRDICEKNDFTVDDFRDQWIDFPEFLSYLPTLRSQSYDSVLATAAVQEMRDSHAHYYFQIDAVLREGEPIPLERLRGTIRRILFNQRKGEIIRAHEEELCARAAEMGEVKIFADEKPKKDE